MTKVTLLISMTSMMSVLHALTADNALAAKNAAIARCPRSQLRTQVLRSLGKIDEKYPRVHDPLLEVFSAEALDQLQKEEEQLAERFETFVVRPYDNLHGTS